MTEQASADLDLVKALALALARLFGVPPRDLSRS